MQLTNMMNGNMPVKHGERGRIMIRCTNCNYLCNKDPDGMILTCALTGQRVFINDLPFTVMSKCPKITEFEQEIEIEVKCDEDNSDRY